jgi:hypothetical protein
MERAVFGRATKRWLLRILAVAVGTVLASGTIIGYACWQNPVAYQEIRDRAAEEWVQFRAERIGTRARLAQKTHEWAGVYGVGMWGDLLFLSPDGEFALFHGSWCGTCARWAGYGRLQELGDRKAALDPAVASESHDLYQQPLLFVSWGEFTFVVPESRIQEFCEQAAEHQSFPGFRVRPAPEPFSEPVIPPGLPEVPEQYAYLLR